MKLQVLLKKNNIVLPNEIIKICELGLHIMEKSVDPVHDRNHVERIFTMLDELVNKNSNVGKMISYEILLPAICWHDSWKSLRVAKNPVQYIYHQLAEGFGSVIIFSKYARMGGIQRRVIKTISFVIRKHSLLFMLFPTTSLELKILLDLDAIEMWHFERLETVNKQLLNRKSAYKKLTIIFFKILSKRKLHFHELNDTLQKKIAIYINGVNNLLSGGR